MAWQTVSNSYWLYDGYGADDCKNKLYVVLQYDSASVTTTSVSVRFLLRRIAASEEKGIKYYDGFAILLNPLTSSGDKNSNISKYQLKDATTSKNPWPDANYASASFTLKKNARDTTFPLPAFWFVNTGTYNHDKTASAVFDIVKDGGTMGGYKTTFAASSWSIASSTSVATNGTEPTIEITDNGDNTFTISGALGANGANNAIKSAALYYTTDGSDPSDDNNTKRTRVSLTAISERKYSVDIDITGDCTVKAFTSCVFTYNTASCDISEKSIKFYAAPTAPGTPIISYSKSRLTIRENWTYSWTKADAGNKNSPVQGYRVVLKKNGTSIQIKDSTGKVISSTPSDDNWHTKDTTSLSFTIYPDKNGFLPGDKVQLGVKPYTKYGSGTTLFRSAYTYSDESTVQNAGVVNVKVNNAWKEGQVYVKVNNEWKEAETVQVKTSAGWKESQ